MDYQIELPWGDSSLGVTLPQDWTILGVLKPAHNQGTQSQEISEALASPIGADRPASRDLFGKRVVVVVDDHSPPTPVQEFIQPLFGELESAGVRDDDVQILIATGVHRPSNPDEMLRKLGREVLSRYAWRCHDAYDSGGLADVGTTSRGTRIFVSKLLVNADFIVCVGALEPHLLLGFGGGLKMIIPGCAGAQTIGKNHMQGVDSDHFDYVGIHGDDSPMRLDLEEGAQLLHKEIFIVNAVMSEAGRPIRFFCGDPIKAHRAGERFVADLLRLEVPQQSDVVLTDSCPMDSDLRQSAKCLGNTLYACKPGGVMLGCVRAELGLGEMPLAKKTFPYTAMRALLKVLGKNRILPLVEKAKQGEPIEEVFIGHFVSRCFGETTWPSSVTVRIFLRISGGKWALLAVSLISDRC